MLFDLPVPSPSFFSPISISLPILFLAPVKPYFISPAPPDAPVPPVHPGARYLLSQHPEVEARVVAELDALELLVTPSRPQPRELEWADLGRLTYLQAVIKARQPLI